MTEIPVYADVSARYSMEIVLNGLVYVLRFNWNSRDSAWYMDIVSNAGVDILAGVKLVPQYLLLKQYSMLTGMPSGDFWLWDTELNSQTSNLSYDNFGSRYRLIFLTPAEVTDLEAYGGI